MSDVFTRTTRPDRGLFYSRNDRNDPRMGEFVHSDPDYYAAADIVIVGCPQDEGVMRIGGRIGSAAAPEAIREQFYQLTPFNIKKSIFDIGDVQIGSTLEETHDNLVAVIERLLRDGKRIIVLGGGNDISYPDGVAMSEVFGPKMWIGVHIDSHLDVRISDQRNSGTPYRQLLDEGHLLPQYFYEVGYQTHFCSPVYYEYLRDNHIHRISLELLRSRSDADIELKEQIRQNFIGHSTSLNTFFSFDLNVVRSADAPGTTHQSPLGLRAGEFIQLVKYAASLANTKIIEFSEVNPTYDVDNRTTKLVAIGMHRFCSGVA